MPYDRSVYGDIKLGMKVKDAVSGFTGTAFSFFETANLRQVAIQPMGDGNKLDDLMSFDVPSIIIVDAVHLTASVIQPDESLLNKFEFGDPCEDRNTGFVGKAYTRSVYMNGCVTYSLRPVVGADNKIPEAQAFNANDLINKRVVETNVPVPKTGGAVTRVGRAV